MDFLGQILNNKAFYLPVLAWFFAQLFKFLANYVVSHKIDIRKMVSAGGMPSSHSAITMCLTTVVGMNDGFGSTLFAIAFIFSLVVMADAAGVRRAAGKQAEVLNKLIHHTGVIRLDKELKELLGHTPVQVFVGGALGILIAVLFS